MKRIITIAFLSLLAMLAFAGRTIDLYYTDDGKNVKTIRGYFINDDLTLDPDGDQSWLVIVGQKFGPNGYLPKDSKLQIGKSHASFIALENQILGIGQGHTFERSLAFEDIDYIVPDPVSFEPFHVYLNDGTKGQLFVNGEYTESPAPKVIRGDTVYQFNIINLKYSVAKSNRGPQTRPDQIGVPTRAISFSEQALKKAIRYEKLP